MLQALNPKHPIWCSWTSSEVFLSEWNWSQQTTAALRRKSQSGDEMNLSFPFLFSFQWKLCKVPTEEFSLKRNKTWTHFRRNLSFLLKFFFILPWWKETRWFQLMLWSETVYLSVSEKNPYQCFWSMSKNWISEEQKFDWLQLVLVAEATTKVDLKLNWDEWPYVSGV